MFKTPEYELGVCTSKLQRPSRAGDKPAVRADNDQRLGASAVPPLALRKADLVSALQSGQCRCQLSRRSFLKLSQLMDQHWQVDALSGCLAFYRPGKGRSRSWLAKCLSKTTGNLGPTFAPQGGDYRAIMATANNRMPEGDFEAPRNLLLPLVAVLRRKHAPACIMFSNKDVVVRYGAAVRPFRLVFDQHE